MNEGKTNIPIPFHSVLIYGMGMMGASLARALRLHTGFTGTISGVVRSRESASLIREHGLADEVHIAADLNRKSIPDLASHDFIVLGLPVRSVAYLLANLPSFSGLVTDMSSTRRLVQQAAERREDIRFIGSHPMCGSEDTGPGAFVENLFQDRLCILTPRTTDAENPVENPDARQVEQFWKALGMHTYFLNGESHDELLAYLSHAPHLIASILTIWARKNPHVDGSIQHAPIPVTGGGFKSMARIAGSNPEMWTDILNTNRDNLLASLELFARELDEVVKHLRATPDFDWQCWFREARQARNRLCGYPDSR